MTNLELFLSRLQKVREERRGQWVACCPAHDDRNPSMAIGQGEDGRVLVHCHSGCSAHDIVTAIGLQLQDLFPPTDRHYPSLMAHIHTRPKHLEHDDRVLGIAEGIERPFTDDEKAAIKRAVKKGGRSDGFAAEVRREASKPLPSQTLESVDTEEDWNALLTEARWLLDNTE